MTDLAVKENVEGDELSSNYDCHYRQQRLFLPETMHYGT